MTEEEKKDQEQKDKYARTFLNKLDNSPDELTKFEKRLGEKLKEHRSRADQLVQETNQMRDQLKQGEARLRSLELQLESAAGKANGVLETIVELHFMDSEESGNDS